MLAASYNYDIFIKHKISLNKEEIKIKFPKRYKNNWRPPSLSELTPMLFNTGLSHLGSEASK